MTSTRHVATLVAFTLATSIGACGSGDDPNGGGNGPVDPAADGGGPVTDPTQAAPFEPVGPMTYVPKVKSLLTGLAATDAEVQAVVKDPNALKGLIDQWMALPSFQLRMVDFFRNAFQQNQVDIGLLQTSLNSNFQINDTLSSTLARNLMDSFALTAWELVKEGRPFNETLGTDRYMLTTAMMSTMSFLDDMHVSDDRKSINRLGQRNAVPQYTLDTASTNTQAESLDPTSPKYMIWKMPGVLPAGCTTTSITYKPANANDGNYYNRMFSFFMGKTQFDPCAAAGANVGQQRYAQQYLDTDYTDWRMVTMHTDAAAAGATPAFYDVVKMRGAKDLTLHTPRIGFFGTLAFATNWATNQTNEGRVTANQSLIVALGQSIEGESTIVNFPVNATDASHATDPACKGCHSQLDPYKQFFRQSYSLYYSDQTDPAVIAQPASFSLYGVTTTGHGVGDLAKAFAAHPRYPLAWTTKLHFWANSTPAIEGDPEVVRIAAAFQASKFDFKTLVRELFSSPLITYASATQTTTTNGVIDSIARRDQFCASLSNRLGLPDVCGMLSTKQTKEQAGISAKAQLMPVDTYYRAYALPSLPTNPDLFFRQSVEAICRLVSDQVVDPKVGTAVYQGAAPEPALDAFVGTVMGLVPSDPRAKAARDILADNLTASIASGATPTDALKATFTLACIAPSSIAVGL